MNNMGAVLLLSILLLGCIGGTGSSGNGAMEKSQQGIKELENGATATPVNGETGGGPADGAAELEPPALTEAPAGAQEGSSAETIQKSVYAPFGKTGYEDAKREGRVIFLYFFANWCPICRAEKPNLDAVLTSLPYKNVAAFVVNYKDSETDADEEALARQFNVPYQHTIIILDAGGAEKFRSLSPLGRESILDELQKAGAE